MHSLKKWRSCSNITHAESSLEPSSSRKWQRRTIWATGTMQLLKRQKKQLNTRSNNHDTNRSSLSIFFVFFQPSVNTLSNNSTTTFATLNFIIFPALSVSVSGEALFCYHVNKCLHQLIILQLLIYSRAILRFISTKKFFCCCCCRRRRPGNVVSSCAISSAMLNRTTLYLFVVVVAAAAVLVCWRWLSCR